MDIKIPKELIFHIKTPGIKAAMLSNIKSPNPGDCENCGGVGRLFVFIAAAGPLKSCPSGAGGKHHFQSDRWWTGEWFSGVCPECEGRSREDRALDIYNVDTKKMERDLENSRSIVKDD